MTKVLGTNGRSISDSIHSLETMGALTIDGDLMTKPHWPTYREDWVDRPRLTLIPELRAQDNHFNTARPLAYHYEPREVLNDGN